MTLRRPATQRDQRRRLRRGLDTLGDALLVEGTSEVHHGIDDRGVALVDADARDEGAVELDRVDREAAQVGQRRVAGAEVVECDPHAEQLQALEPRPGGHDVVEHHALRDLQPDRARSGDRRIGHLGDHAGEARVLQLPGRDVHREAQVAPPRQRLPLRELLAGRLEHPGTDRDDQSGLLGDGDELRRLHQASVVAPAQERLHPGDPPGGELDHRLVEELELLAVTGATQRRLDALTFGRPLAQLLVEDHPTTPTVALGAVHRRVGIAEHGRRVGVGLVRERDADRHAELDLATAGPPRGAQRRLDAVRDDDGVLGPVEPFAEHDELVAPEAGDRVARADDRRDPFRHTAQHLVTERVAEGVVHRLEVVDVDEQQRDRRATGDLTQTGEGVTDTIEEQRAVGQACERVVGRLLLERHLEPLAVPDVAPDRRVELRGGVRGVVVHQDLRQHRHDLSVGPHRGRLA